MFLTIDDYKSVCDSFEFEQVCAAEAERLTAERAAMEQNIRTTANPHIVVH